MRFAVAVPLIVAGGLAFPALAQSAGPSAASPAKDVSSAVANTNASQHQPQVSNPEADAALAIAIRQREAQERMLQMACKAGDTSKCQMANASTTAKTPSP